jgi:hypothetical protein
MTANAKKLINRANSQEPAAVAIPTQPAATLRVFITALAKRAVAIEKEYWALWVLLNHTAACREARIELGIDDATRNCIGQRCTASMP